MPCEDIFLHKKQTKTVLCRKRIKKIKLCLCDLYARAQNGN